METKISPKKKLEEMIGFCESKVEYSKELEFGQIDSSNKNNYYIINNQTNKKYAIYLINSKSTTKKKLMETANSNAKEHNFRTDFIFYKDCENFFQRLIDKKGFISADKSLKKYSKADLQKIMILNLLERTVMLNFREDKIRINKSNLLDKYIKYYQPQTQRLSQGIRIFKPSPIMLDYSHLNVSDGNRYEFSENHFSKTYFFLDELKK